MSVIIRPARPQEASVIRRMIRQEHLNPFNLDWKRFMVGDLNGEIVATGQIRVYTRGYCELASLVVLPAYRGKGICRQLIEALLEREQEQIFIILDATYAPSYKRYGFGSIAPRRLPAALRRIYRIGCIITGLVRAFGGKDMRVIPLRRSAQKELR